MSAKTRKQTEADTDRQALDANQEAYRKQFGIVDKYLIDYQYDPSDQKDNGYIVFIDFQNDLDYIDCRDLNDPAREREQNRWIAKLQHAEASQCKHLPESQQMDFKRMLGVGYQHVLNGNFDDVAAVIDEAKTYLRKRNKEYSRELFLKSGLPAALSAGILGLVGYFAGYRNPWIYGILFGILGAFVSIWTRYGKVQFTGQAHNRLHILECYSRLLIGTIFAVIAMVAIQCQLILPNISGSEKLYSFIIAAFIASFSERFIPSIVERITKDESNPQP